jgi:hypothetical protein
MALPQLADFRLVGGTALALHLGHRLSVDIDMFADSAFDSATLSAPLVKEFGLSQASISTNSISGVINGIKTDFIAHRYPWLDGALCAESIRIATIRDIAAMKLNAISNRGSRKDFWDIAALLKTMSLPDLLSCFEMRYPHVNNWHAVRSLTYFEDAEADPDPVALDDTTWSDVKSTIITATKDIL